MPQQVSATVPTVSDIEELKTLLLEGEKSGEPIVMSPEEWTHLREDLEADARLRRKAS